jgi:tRNA 2-thiouridine synthesizing protein A
MSTTVDARGLSCPQPVLMTMEAIKVEKSGQIVILVDTETSKENVVRAAGGKGWRITKLVPEGVEYRIVIEKD